MEAAAGSRIVYGAVWVLIYARFLHRLVGFDASALIVTYAKSGAAAVAALAPLALTYAFWLGPAHITLPVLIPAVGIGIGLWVVVLVAMRHPALDDLIGIVEHMPFGRLVAPLTRYARAHAG